MNQEDIARARAEDGAAELTEHFQEIAAIQNSVHATGWLSLEARRAATAQDWDATRVKLVQLRDAVVAVIRTMEDADLIPRQTPTPARYEDWRGRPIGPKEPA